jgi:hypothetical protein
LPFKNRKEWTEHIGLDHEMAPEWRNMPCPICQEQTGGGRKACSIHIATHLEEIALAALPTDLEVGDESDQSSQYNPSTSSSHCGSFKEASLTGIPKEGLKLGVDEAVNEETEGSSIIFIQQKPTTLSNMGSLLGIDEQSVLVDGDRAASLDQFDSKDVEEWLGTPEDVQLQEKLNPVLIPQQHQTQRLRRQPPTRYIGRYQVEYSNMLPTVPAGPAHHITGEHSNKPKQNTSSYWSVIEEEVFQACLAYYGTDFQSIAIHIYRKTPTMVCTLFFRISIS